MDESNWVRYVTAFGSVATPILVLVLTGIGWRIRNRLERRIELEDKLREDRVEIYHEILKPFVILLTSEDAWKSDPKNKNKDKNEVAIKIILSLEYRNHGFRLSLVGSDEVVKSYSNLMQYYFDLCKKAHPSTNKEIKEQMSLLGQFLLEIRKSMGNEATKLDNWDMLEWFLTDVREYR